MTDDSRLAGPSAPTAAGLIDAELTRVRLEIAALQAEENDLVIALQVIERLGAVQPARDEEEPRLDFGTFTSAPPNGSTELAITATAAAASTYADATVQLTNVGAIDVQLTDQEPFDVRIAAVEEAAEDYAVVADEVDAFAHDDGSRECRPVEPATEPEARAVPAGARKVRPYCRQPDACVAGAKGPCRLCHSKSAAETAAAAGEGSTGATDPIDPRPSGIALHARLMEAARPRGLTQTAVSKAAFGNCTQMCMMAKAASPVRPATLRKAEEWLASLGPMPETAAPIADPGETVEAGPIARDIRAFLDRSGMTKTRFGKDCLNDSKFVGTLDGKTCLRAKTAAKIRAFIAAHDANDQGASGTARKAPSAAESTAASRDTVSAPSEGEPPSNPAPRPAAPRSNPHRREAERLLERDPDVAKGRNGSITAAINDIRRQQAEEARHADPVEQAKLALQRKGLTVYSAVVTGGRKDRFIVSGQDHQLTPAELIDLAERKTGQRFRRAA